MPTYTIQIPDGRHMVVEAPDEQTALTGVQDWHAQNIGKTTADLSSLSDDDLRALHSAPDVTKISDKDLQAAHAAHTAVSKTDTSMLGALGQGTADVVEGVGKTVKDYVSPEWGKAILATKAAQHADRYKSASEQFIHPDDGADSHTLGLDWSQLPRAAVEQAPGLAMDVAGQVLTKKLGPVGQWIANTLTYGARTAGNEAEKRAQARTGNPEAEPTTEDKLTGLTSTLAQSALNKMGSNAIVSPGKVTATGVRGALQAGGNVLKAAGTEGLTNAGQDLISQGFIKQGTDQPIDTQEALGAGVMGAAGGGVFGLPKGVKETVTATRMRDVVPDEHTAMAANRIAENAGGVDKLGNVKTAYDATTRAVADVQRELGDAANRVTNPSAEAANAIEAARRGDPLSKRDLAAIDAEGNEQLSSLARQTTALSKLTGMGKYDESAGTFIGGTHQTAKKLITPFAKRVGELGAFAGAGAMGSGGVGFDTIASHVPAALEGLAGAVAAYKGLKTLDKGLGLASPAKTFAEKFGDGSGNVRVPTMLNQSPTGPKVAPASSATPAQPWGPTPEPSMPFKPDVLEPGIGKIVEKIQRQKQQQTTKDAMPLLRRLAQEASASNAVKKLREVPEAHSTKAPTAPVGTSDSAEPFVLPESPYWSHEPDNAASFILKDALDGGKPIRNEQAYHAGTVRRLKAEEDIYKRISDAMQSVKERGDFHKYLSALWGSDTPDVVSKVRDQMMTEFPQYGVTILKHLPDDVIKGLWNTKPTRKS
ncbi:hypothetical protein [Bradyrhizobium liaoningense]|uniref:hypothetical protein n=1 Tax=Bradyrhizobium liaoningense TaxID=43992 RepID=UPI001BA84800|nr:hypothetical protein [Bradyrhizobium liaoningense]MBR1169144.1 hypothetical protein [Bradyrhizobium liaoningense]